MFACYSGGTPKHNNFIRYNKPGVIPTPSPEIAPYPFISQLPISMLGRSRAALAVVGHVERAWGYSFDWGRAGPYTTVFESTLERRLIGHPIGSALEYLNQRYAELFTMLSDELEDIDTGRQYDPYELAGMWTASNDARGYVLIGDPAIRISVAEQSKFMSTRIMINIKFVITEMSIISGLFLLPMTTSNSCYIVIFM